MTEAQVSVAEREEIEDASKAMREEEEILLISQDCEARTAFTYTRRVITTMTSRFTVVQC